MFRSCSHDTPSRIPLICNTNAVIYEVNTMSPKHLKHRNRPKNSPSVNSLVPLAVIALVLAFYIAMGACIFSLWEEWSLLDGAYFCFVTLTTIGKYKS